MPSIETAYANNQHVLDLVAAIMAKANVLDVRVFIPHNNQSVMNWLNSAGGGLVFETSVARPTAADPNHFISFWTTMRFSDLPGEANRATFLASVDASLTPPPVDLVAFAADKRWRVETGGVPFGGMILPSDDRAKMLIMGAAGTMANEAAAPFVIGGTSVTLTGAQFKAAHAAIVAHVQACFAKQASILAGIANGSITTTTQIEQDAWPTNA